MGQAGEQRSVVGVRCTGNTVAAELTRELATSGIELDVALDRGVSLLWIDGGEEAAPRVLRELNPRGSSRVLVLDAGPRELGSAKIWELLRAGAADVMRFSAGESVVAAIAARLQRWAAVEALLETAVVKRRLVGSSPQWLATLRELVEVAAFTDSSLLLRGESGVGKEEAARLVHTLDARPNKGELVVLDCTTVVAEVAGSEFFGHERGAFTGAAAARDGAFALADGGTLFLDEVGELPLPLQAQLLRVIQEHTFKRVGANVWQRTDFRLICATNRDLEAEVESGRFRRDLYHRIAAWSCRLPALRERSGDVLALAQHFLKELVPYAAAELCAPLREFLLGREYPGNTRELRQLMTRIAKRHVGPGPITVGDIPPDDRGAATELGCWPDHNFESAVARALELGVGLKEIGRVATDTAIRLALHGEDGNLQRAARRLGVTDRALQIRRAQREVEGD
jgi:transcriptional regulator with GAF, ATPase, and Fis domain